MILSAKTKDRLGWVLGLMVGIYSAAAFGMWDVRPWAWETGLRVIAAIVWFCMSIAAWTFPR
ncbi:hypothetical protein HMPREF1487_04359 [Pseudomonas sp. HPB0071]|nr:hypothetical protein HMPREF1487_04359 [Pseudomonas sp. HPB0071]